MKKLCWILALFLLLSGCTASLEPVQTQPPQTEAPATEATEPAPTEPPDAGIASVVIETPKLLTVRAEQPDGPLDIRFVNVDPQGEPEGGRRCTLSLLRGDELITKQSVCVQEGTALSLPLRYTFTRYMTQTEDELVLQLAYGEERIETKISVVLENEPDEVYAERSGDPKPYSIDVLRNENVVAVYGKDDNGEYTQLVHAFLCSTGGATPYGTYSLGWKVPWRSLFGGVFGQYAMNITGNILFHSVPYRWLSKDTLKSEEFNKLGTKASLGCVRMAVADVKWIYDYCPIGTAIHIYDVEALPFARPAQTVIDVEDPRAGWDPTDPDPENPWLTELPAEVPSETITGDTA